MSFQFHHPQTSSTHKAAMFPHTLKRASQMVAKNSRFFSDNKAPTKNKNDQSKIDSMLTSSSSTELLTRTITFVPGIQPSAQKSTHIGKLLPLNFDPKQAALFQQQQQQQKQKQQMQAKDDFRSPERVLVPESKMYPLLAWKHVTRVGCGFHNLGNTCFLNASLQSLLYSPPFANYLLSKEHSHACHAHNFCLFCEMEKLVHAAFTSPHAFAPKSIVGNIRAIGKMFRPGRQEDAHEFIRFVMDSLQNSSLVLHGKPKDDRIKETTIVHRIFGGYLRSQVRCTHCHFNSNTYDAFLDLSLEVFRIKSLDMALRHFTMPETLDEDNLYRCLKYT